MPLKLTPRQKDFLGKFLELYQEGQGSLHYSFVAKKLGIAKVTAYEMLCALEKLGLVRREYHPRKGPGRYAVRFFPSTQTLDLKSLGKEWEEVHSFLARLVEKAKDSGPEELREEFLRELPENPSPLLLMAGLTAIAVSALLRAVKKGQVAEIQSLLRAMPSPGAIAGFVVGVALAAGVSPEVIHKSMAGLKDEAYQALADFAKEFLQILSQEVKDEGV